MVVKNDEIRVQNVIFVSKIKNLDKFISLNRTLMYQISNQLLKIAVKKTGAELCEISSVQNKKQFMWNADPTIWHGFSPILFPFIGALKKDSYLFNNKSYTMPKHGFTRRISKIKLCNQTNNSLTFKLIYDDDLLEIYPFKFEFLITYTLQNNIINVKHTVRNLDSKSMYFSLGGHPAFKCPVYEGENYSDYSLVFEHKENSETYLINLKTGLQTSETTPVFNNSTTIPLHYNLFDKDALIFKDLKSKKVSLQSKTHGGILSVKFDDFPYLGIWAKPNSNYVCIEPWLGIADQEQTNQELTKKEGIIKLNANDIFSASYSIEIYKTHLAKETI